MFFNRDRNHDEKFSVKIRLIKSGFNQSYKPKVDSGIVMLLHGKGDILARAVFVI